MLKAIVNGDRVGPSKGVEGRCPGCGQRLKPKAVNSLHVTPHWAHEAKDCDPWHEPETEWHRAWKQRYPEDQREVWMPPHRADVRTQGGVIELQHSSISSEAISEREAFYGSRGRMVWIVDASAWDLGHRSREYLYTTQYANAEYDTTRVNFELLREQAFTHGQDIQFTWRHPRKSWRVARQPIILDLGGGKLVRLTYWNWESRVGVFCRGVAIILGSSVAPP